MDNDISIWDEQPTVRLAKEILANDESRAVYRNILTRRRRMGTDPDYADPAKREEAAATAATFTDYTAQYILFAARAIERLSQYAKETYAREISTQAGYGATPDILDGTITGIWSPLPEASHTDFYWLEATYAAVMSNHLVETVERICIGAAGLLTDLEEYFPELGLAASIEPLLGKWSTEIAEGFDAYYRGENRLTAITLDAIGARLAVSLLGGRPVWPRLGPLPRLAPPPLSMQYPPLFDVTFEGDPVVKARRMWLDVKTSPPENGSRSQGDDTTFDRRPPKDRNPPAAPGVRPPEPQGRRGGIFRQVRHRTVWYATDRAQTDPQAKWERFGDRRDALGRVWYGQCVVEISPSGRRTPDDSPPPRIVEHPNYHGEYDHERFYREFGQHLDRHGRTDRQILIFLHGFWTSFDSAVQTAAKLADDLDFRGETACFSWPSENRGSAYGPDEEHIAGSKRHATEFLTALLARPEARKVHVVAHSMGNRLLANALSRMDRPTGHECKFDQLILVAPDIGVEDFCGDFMTCYKSLAQRTTLYTASNDQALRASEWIHDGPRVGFHTHRSDMIARRDRPITVVPNINTVEVCEVNLTWVGHSYHSDSKRVQKDMSVLLRSSPEPDARSLGHDVENRPNPACPLPPHTDRTYWILGRR